MSTADTVKEQLRTLVELSNITTGKADTTLTSAITTLINGYGSSSSELVASGNYNNTTDGFVIDLPSECNFVICMANEPDIAFTYGGIAVNIKSLRNIAYQANDYCTHYFRLYGQSIFASSYQPTHSSGIDFDGSKWTCGFMRHNSTYKMQNGEYRWAAYKLKIFDTV